MPDNVEGQVVKLKGELNVFELLGEGSFAQVYLVSRNLPTGATSFALKVFRKEAPFDVLKAEAEALSKVRSQHCVAMYSVEQVNGSMALLLEYIEGVTLYELARDESLNSAEINEVLFQVHKGLWDLNTQGFVHGDLSPKNIMIEKTGRVVLLDFGLSKLLGKRFGTPRYMSSRCLEGREPTFEDDLCALQLIQWELRHGLIGKRLPMHHFKRRMTEQLIIQSSSSEKSRASLSDRVQRILDIKRSNPKTVCLKPIESPTRLKRICASILFVLLFASSAPSHRIQNGLLTIRSIKWVELKMENGHIIETNRPGVTIPVGRHLLRWRTKDSKGVLPIYLTENSELVLTDTDFQ